MTLDGNQAVRLSYDINNLVHSAKKTAAGQNPNPAQDELTATYSYFADGTKYSIKDTSGNSRIYIGPFTLASKDYPSSNSGNTTVQHITLLESADMLGSDARFAFAATPNTTSGADTTYTVAYETLYLLKDHLGSIRTITDSQGKVLERNDYYPYGLQTNLGRNYATLGDKYRVRMPASFASGNPSISNLSVSSPSIEMSPYRMLYNGKELQMIAQTRFVDYGARQYDPTIARWNGMDPMAEKYYSFSLFSYCANSPIINIDSYGNDYKLVIKEGTIYICAVYVTREKDKQYLSKALMGIQQCLSNLTAVLDGEEYDLVFDYTIQEVSSEEEFETIKSEVSDRKYKGILNTYETDNSIITGFEAQTSWSRIIKNKESYNYKIDYIQHEILHTLGVIHHDDNVGLMNTKYSDEVGNYYIYNKYIYDILAPIMEGYEYLPERNRTGKHKGGIEKRYNIIIKNKKRKKN